MPSLMIVFVHMAFDFRFISWLTDSSLLAHCWTTHTKGGGAQTHNSISKNVTATKKKKYIKKK